MKIRQATNEDIPALGQVYMEAFAGVDPEEKWTATRAADLVEFLINKQPDLAYLVEHNGRVGGGICGLVKPWWDGNHLVETEIFLAPRCQRQKVGTSLFAHFLENAIKKYSITEIESLTFKDLDFPLSWYVNLGFEPKTDWQVILGDARRVLHQLRQKM